MEADEPLSPLTRTIKTQLAERRPAEHVDISSAGCQGLGKGAVGI